MRDFVLFDHFGPFVYTFSIMEGAMESIDPLMIHRGFLATRQKPEITRRMTLRIGPWQGTTGGHPDGVQTSG